MDPETPESLEAAASELFRRQRPAFVPGRQTLDFGELIAERMGAPGHLIELRRLTHRADGRRTRYARWRFDLVTVDSAGGRHLAGSTMTVGALSLPSLAALVAVAMRAEAAGAAAGVQEDDGR